jgi:hypothetical protein
MPSGAEVRVFKSGNALISRNGVKVFRTSGMDFDDLDPTALGKKGIVGNNDQLRRTFQDAETHPNKWREGKDIEESAGKFGTWFETMTGALASEVVERSVDVGIGLLEHDYLSTKQKTSNAAGSGSTASTTAANPIGMPRGLPDFSLGVVAAWVLLESPYSVSTIMYTNWCTDILACIARAWRYCGIYVRQIIS